MRTKKRQFGDWGEGQAASFLKKKGYTIIATNYTTRNGEIDIIAWHQKPNGNTLCFVEVKTRRGEAGSAERATNYKKIERMKTAALQYAQKENINVDTVHTQFEHVSVYVNANDKITLDHYEIPML